MTQKNKPEWRTIAFFKHVSLQYSKTTFLKRKLYLHSLYFSQNRKFCILFFDFTRVTCLRKFSRTSCKCFKFWLDSGLFCAPLARVITLALVFGTQLKTALNICESWRVRIINRSARYCHAKPSLIIVPLCYHLICSQTWPLCFSSIPLTVAIFSFNHTSWSLRVFFVIYQLLRQI